MHACSSTHRIGSGGVYWSIPLFDAITCAWKRETEQLTNFKLYLIGLGVCFVETIIIRLILYCKYKRLP